MNADSGFRSRSSDTHTDSGGERERDSDHQTHTQTLRERERGVMGLTVLVTAHLQRQVLLPELVVHLLKVLDVVDGFAQNTRLMHLSFKTDNQKPHEHTLELPACTAAAHTPWRRCP